MPPATGVGVGGALGGCDGSRTAGRTSETNCTLVGVGCGGTSASDLLAGVAVGVAVAVGEAVGRAVILSVRNAMVVVVGSRSRRDTATTAVKRTNTSTKSADLIVPSFERWAG